MATYTAVLVTPNELEQDDVIEMLERIGVVAFCGPGSLVESVDPVGTEADGMAAWLESRERAPSEGEFGAEVTVPMEGGTVYIEFGGFKVGVRMTMTDDGPLLSLQALNCGLEGELPGEYYLVATGGALRAGGAS